MCNFERAERATVRSGLARPSWLGAQPARLFANRAGERLGPLIVCDEGGVGADEYENIIYDGLFSLIDDLLQDQDAIRVADKSTFLFMQDNSTVHKATDVMEFLAENHIPVMEWSVQSPDLNPLENL